MKVETLGVPSSKTSTLPSSVRSLSLTLVILLLMAAVIELVQAVSEGTVTECGPGPYDCPKEISSFVLMVVGRADVFGQKLAYFIGLLAIFFICVAESHCLISRSVFSVFEKNALSVSSLIFDSLSRGEQKMRGVTRSFIRGMRSLCTKRLLGAFLLLIVPVLAVVPGFFVPTDLSNSSSTLHQIFQAHFSIVLGGGEKLGSGFRLISDTQVYYGMVWPSLVAWYTSEGGHLGIGGYFKVIHALTLVCLLLVTRSYYVYSRKRWECCLVPVLVLAVTYQFNNSFITGGAPNHTAWRHFFLPLVPFVIFLTRKLSWTLTSFVFGGVSALGLLGNFETGVAIAAGFVTYLIIFFGPKATGMSPFYAILRSGSYWLCGLIVSVMCLALFLGMLVGGGSWKEILASGLVFPWLFGAGGYAGERFSPNPLALLIWIHAACVCIQSWSRWRSSNANIYLSTRCAVATMLLVWFMYFAHRPAPEYLSCFYLLYCFLLIDLIRIGRCVRKYRLISCQCSFAVISLCIILPYLAPDIKKAGVQFVQGLTQSSSEDSNKILVDGVYLPNIPEIEELFLKASFLKGFYKDRPLVYFTKDSFYMPKLSGRWSHIPYIDPLWEAFNRERFATLIASIHNGPSSYILIDVQNSGKLTGVSSPNFEKQIAYSRDAFHQLIREQISSTFLFSRIESGWEIWQRKR